MVKKRPEAGNKSAQGSFCIQTNVVCPGTGKQFCEAGELYLEADGFGG